MNLLKEFWVEQNGSIFTHDSIKVRVESGSEFEKKVPVAFNLGREVSKHIVFLHNSALIREHRKQHQSEQESSESISKKGFNGMNPFDFLSQIK